MSQQLENPAPGIGVAAGYHQTIAAAETVEQYRRRQDAEMSAMQNVKIAEENERMLWMGNKFTVGLIKYLELHLTRAEESARVNVFIPGKERETLNSTLQSAVFKGILNYINGGKA